MGQNQRKQWKEDHCQVCLGTAWFHAHCHQREHWTLLYVFIKSNVSLLRHLHNSHLGFRDSKCLASLLVRSDILRLHTVMEFPSREIQFSCSIQTLSLRVSAINNYKTETNKRYKYWKGYILIFAISMSVDLGNPKLTAKLLEAIW